MEGHAGSSNRRIHTKPDHASGPGPRCFAKVLYGGAGNDLIQRLDFEEMRFSLFSLAFIRSGEQVPEDPVERAPFVFLRETTLELTHNW